LTPASSRSHVVLVTGAAGFIGRHVSAALHSRGHRVVGLVRPGHDTQGLAETVLDDLSDLDRLAEVLTTVRPTAVCHCAWSGHPRSAGVDYPGQIVADLVPSTNLAVAAGLAGVQQFVLISSGGALRQELAGDGRPPAYGWAKRATESVIEATSRDFGYRVTVLRPTAVYGPGQDPANGLGAVAVFAANMLRGDSVRLFGSTDAGRDFLHVADLADCVARVIEMGLAGTYDVGGPEVVRLRELIGLLELVLARPADVQVAGRTGVDPELVELDNGPITGASGWRPNRRLETSLPEVVVDVAVRLRLTSSLPDTLRLAVADDA
jgi:UDP-glucose 4-epimerase